MDRVIIKRFLLLVSLALFLSACGSSLPAGGSLSSPPTYVPTLKATHAAKEPLTTGNTCPVTMALSGGTCFTPYQLRIYYGLQSLSKRGYIGKGQTVVDIVSFGSPTLQQDMNRFDTYFHLPPIQIQVISPLHVPESDPHHDKYSWAGETEMDVQIIHALAPGAKIVVLTSPVAETEGTLGLPEFLQLEQYAQEHHLGNIVSQSWGASEATLKDAESQKQLKAWTGFFQRATTQGGMTFFASSGDNGATDYTDLQAQNLVPERTTSFPTDNPWVTSVGGTTTLLNSGGAIHEVAWSHSGGGFSAYDTEPDYQKTLPSDTPAATLAQFQGRRGIPDVAAAADPATGMAFTFQSRWEQAGGTSAAAPVWAALMAIADQMAGKALGFLNPALYKIASGSNYTRDFHDITVGSNTVSRRVQVEGFSAVPGWDAVTGLGTPNAQFLLPDLIRELSKSA